MYNRLLPLVLLLMVSVLVGNGVFYIVPEGKQVIITQFGKPIGEAKVTAGLYFKLPFIQEVVSFEKRILNWDGKPNQIPTKDKKYIYADTTARWRIVDALKFLKAVKNERTAISRIDTIIENATRDVVSSHNLVETVRNTNAILEQQREREQAALQEEDVDAAAALTRVLDEEITGEMEKIQVGREKLSEKIVNHAHEELQKYGIDLIDVQLRRITYEETVEKEVYERMISERQRIAEKIRSIGRGKQAEIQGNRERELQGIESGAYQTVQKIKGEAEAAAIRIYAEAVGANAEFYEFLRTLEAYAKTAHDGSSYILSADSAFFRLLKSGRTPGDGISVKSPTELTRDLN